VLVAVTVARSCPGLLIVGAPPQAEIDAIASDLALFSDLPGSKFPARETEPGERVIYDENSCKRLPPNHFDDETVSAASKIVC
jgi:hypothetical protein